MPSAVETSRPRDDRPGASARFRWLLTRPLVAGTLLLLVYAGLSLANDTAGTLGADTGAKIVTVEKMVANGSLRPDIGYWAAPYDPDARVHGWMDTRHTDGIYVDVTTLPMLVASYPLWNVGGVRGGLLLPMAGAVVAAFVARALARRLRPDRDGWAAFWLVGLASPLAIYALDFWEHTWGVALMGAGVLVLYDVVERSPRWWRGLLAGALFGAAFAMRNEAVVYTVTSFAVATGVLLYRRRLGAAVGVGVAGIGGFLAMVGANAALETAVVGAPFRAGYAGAISSTAGSAPSDRLAEAAVTSWSPFPTFDGAYLALGALGVGGLVCAAVFASRPARRPIAMTALAVAVLVFVVRLSYGVGFLPGLLAASPLAAVGLGRGWLDARRRLVCLFALVALPGVFVTQWSGGALPQWGARYLLTSGFLLAVVGVASLDELERWARRAMVALACVVTASGLVWMQVRTHAVADAATALMARPEAVLISPQGFPPREFPSTYDTTRWLSVRRHEDLANAVAVVHAAGLDTFAIVEEGEPATPPPSFAGFHQTGRSTIPFVPPVDLTITSYAADR